jgi:hypothetical protein
LELRYLTELSCVCYPHVATAEASDAHFGGWGVFLKLNFASHYMADLEPSWLLVDRNRLSDRRRLMVGPLGSWAKFYQFFVTFVLCWSGFLHT